LRSETPGGDATVSLAVGAFTITGRARHGQPERLGPDGASLLDGIAASATSARRSR